MGYVPNTQNPRFNSYQKEKVRRDWERERERGIQGGREGRRERGREGKRG